MSETPQQEMKPHLLMDLPRGNRVGIYMRHRLTQDEFVQLQELIEELMTFSFVEEPPKPSP